MTLKEMEALTEKDYADRLKEMSKITDVNNRTDKRSGAVILLDCAKTYISEMSAVKK